MAEEMWNGNHDMLIDMLCIELFFKKILCEMERFPGQVNGNGEYFVPELQANQVPNLGHKGKELLRSSETMQFGID